MLPKECPICGTDTGIHNNPHRKRVDIKCRICKKIFNIPMCRNITAKYCSRKCKYKGLSIDRSNELNVNWKGDNVKYKGLHIWIKRRLTKPKSCQCCHKNKPYDLANISQEYKRDVNDFEWLCRKCHMNKDGRIKNLKQFVARK